ncbi:MAG: hypoxanthine phosphoribosyltransferase [Clostridiales bacterium]|jgi:hypoxanthine phosphoribosyltransferase|nr:hypoxanthine phosphoribosyltransferase [Clostridiales bacterium]
MSENIRASLTVLFSEEEINIRITELAEQISNDYKEKKNLVLICVLKGGVFFTIDLSRKLNVECEIEFVELSSYGENFESAKEIIVNKDLICSIENKNIIIIEDIVDTGRTLNYLKNDLKINKKPLSVKTCVMLDKPSRRELDFEADYVGFTIEDKFIIGYGLDYKNKFRNIKYIGYMKKLINT